MSSLGSKSYQESKEEFLNLKSKLEILRVENKGALEKSEVCLELARLSSFMRKDQNAGYYYQLSDIYQKGKVKRVDFYFRLQELLKRVGVVPYGVVGANFFKEIPGYPELSTSDYLFLVEKEAIEKIDCLSLYDTICDYFQNGGTGLISSTTHAIEFDTTLVGTLSLEKIETVEGNPIFVRSGKEGVFSFLTSEMVEYIRKVGFDFTNFPMSEIEQKIKRKMIDKN